MVTILHFSKLHLLYSSNSIWECSHPVIEPEDIPEGFDLEGHNDVVSKFSSEGYNKDGTTGLSLKQLMYLMSTVDKISKILVSDYAELIKSHMAIQMPDLNENWDKDYLKGSQLIFEAFSKLYIHLPEYGEMLGMVTGQYGTAKD